MTQSLCKPALYLSAVAKPSMWFVCLHPTHPVESLSQVESLLSPVSLSLSLSLNSKDPDGSISPLMLSVSITGEKWTRVWRKICYSTRWWLVFASIIAFSYAIGYKSFQLFSNLPSFLFVVRRICTVKTFNLLCRLICSQLHPLNPSPNRPPNHLSNPPLNHHHPERSDQI